MVPSSVPSTSPTFSPSSSPSSLPTYICEKDFIGFDTNGQGFPTDGGQVCVEEYSSVELPQDMSLMSSDSNSLGTVSVELQCVTVDSSELTVTMTLNEGSSITNENFIGVSLQTIAGTLKADLDQDGVQLSSDSNGFNVVIPLEIEGPFRLVVEAEVDGELVTISTDDANICFECGISAHYFAPPDGYLENGFFVNAYSDDDAHTTGQDSARYMHTGLSDNYDNFDSSFVSDEVQTCLIIQENVTTTPYANSAGGSITFNFTEPDDFFEFKLFNIHEGATLFVFSDGNVTTIPVEEAINEVQNIVVIVPDTEMVTIQFDGPGAVCGIKTCIDGTRTENPGNIVINTPAPTTSTAPSSQPSESPSGSFYPSSEPSSIPTDTVQPSDTPSSQPTDCYDKYDITIEDIINQAGSDEPIPEDAVRIINGENANVTIEISQLWTNDANISFFINYHSDTHDTICEGIPDFAYEDTIVKDLECYDGWTDLGIFIYFDDEITFEECEECTPPDQDDENVVAYFFELPCEPICESTPPTSAPTPTMAPSGAPSGAPTDCYDRHDISEEDIINQIGSDEPVPEDAVKIINGANTTVTIEISQLWTNNANLSFFIHYHTETHDTICEGIPDFAFEDTIVKQLECYEGWTDVGIFIYFGDLSLEECEECKPPESDEEGVVAYYFELPCDPICETSPPSKAPSTSPPTQSPRPPGDCYEQHEVTEDDIMDQFGTNESFPEDAITIIGGENSTVTVEISQLWTNTATNLSFFIQYHAEDQGSLCEGIPDFSYEDTIGRDLECFDGWTNLGVFIYLDDDLSFEECEGCKRPDPDDENVIAYYFEFPCVPICETDAPSNAPSIIAPTSAPTDCYDRHGITEEDIIEQFGSEEPIPENAIKIINGENTNVTLEISQLWSENTNVSVFVHYHTEGHGSVCEGIPDFAYEDTIVKDLECYNGWTDVGVFIYFDDEMTLDECQECSPPDADDENVIAYYFEFSCEPICESIAPTEAPVAECHDGILVVQKDTGGDPICEYSSEPIFIEEMDDSGSNEVRFSFSNNWPVTLDTIELYYDRGDGLGQQCQSLNSLGSGEMYPNTLAAACNEETHTVDIEVYISARSISYQSSLGKCGNENVNSCSYIYKLPCSTDVACDDVRRLQSEKVEMVDESEPSGESEDNPYCLHKDYPCVGDEENMVYVCHYSGRAGYQTFCIPEMDSDIFRLNKNHHCGPCDGWNGVDNNANVD